MSLGKFAAATVIFTGKVAYKGALRVGNSLSTASDDFSERWDSPVNGFDATMEKAPFRISFPPKNEFQTSNILDILGYPVTGQ